MKHYAYTAIGHDSKKVTGEIEAENENAVIQYLEINRLIPVDISVKSYTRYANGLSNFAAVKRRKTPDLLGFTRSIGMLIKSGLPLDKALSSVIESLEDEEHKKTIEKVKSRVREGRSFSDAIKESGCTEDEIYLQVVKAGELAGRLDLAMKYLTRHLEEKKELRDSITGMLVYPAILMIVTLISVVMLMMFVIPKFKVLFDDMQGELPLSTQIFIAMSDFVVSYGVLLIPALFLLLLITRQVYRVDKFSRYIDKNILRIKWLGRMISDIQIARFSETVSMLMSNGMSIQKSLQTGSTVITNKWLKFRTLDASDKIKQGGGFYESYCEFYPQIIRQLIRSGEQSGELSSALSNSAEMIKSDVNRNMKKFITILEPMIILLLGTLVAAIISSILSAVLGMNDMIVS